MGQEFRYGSAEKCFCSSWPLRALSGTWLENESRGSKCPLMCLMPGVADRMGSAAGVDHSSYTEPL